jgi:transposase
MRRATECPAVTTARTAATYHVGIDWASTHHDVCVLDDHGVIVDQFRMAHTADGLRDGLARLARHAPLCALTVALERPSGLLVDTLLEAGCPVVPIHPNVLTASRPRYSTAGAKSDAQDAYIAADLLRTDGHRFAPLTAPSDATRALRAAVRTREDLVATRVQLVNQLAALLESFWPGAAQLFADLASSIACVFLRAYPTPVSAARLTEARFARFLARHGYPGRRSAADFLAQLRAAPMGQTGELETEVKGQLVLSLVGILESLVHELNRVDGLMGAHLAQHPDGALIQSFPRTGRINAAQLLAELGDDRRRYASADQLAAEGGVAPVTRASGKHRAVTRRVACNKRLRQALIIWADNSRHAHAWAATVYARARHRGCTHPHAIRILARAWTRVLWRCWQNHTTYNLNDHHSAAQLKAA